MNIAGDGSRLGLGEVEVQRSRISCRLKLENKARGGEYFHMVCMQCCLRMESVVKFRLDSKFGKIGV